MSIRYDTILALPFPFPRKIEISAQYQKKKQLLYVLNASRELRTCQEPSIGTISIGTGISGSNNSGIVLSVSTVYCLVSYCLYVLLVSVKQTLTVRTYVN